MLESVETQIVALPDTTTITELLKIFEKLKSYKQDVFRVERIHFDGIAETGMFKILTKEYLHPEKIGATAYGQWVASEVYNMQSFKYALLRGTFRGMVVDE